MKTTFSNPLRFLFAFCVALWAGAATGVAADQVTDQVTFLAMVPQMTLLVQATSYCFVDVSAPLPSRRFYRVVKLSPEGMVLIPAGSFTMGDNQDGDTSALPVHTVYVSAFFMDQYD